MGNVATVSEPRKLRSGEIERLDPYVFMAVIGKRVIHAGGRTATEQPLKRATISPSDRRALFAGDAIATWPELSAGWPAFNLNERQHRESLRRLAGFDSEIVAVGHGEPIRSGGQRHVRDLVDGLER